MSFRLKLLVATMLVVVGVTTAALVATQQNVDRVYTQIFHERFEDQVRLLRALQEARLASVKSQLLDVSRSQRLLAVLEAEVPSPAEAPDADRAPADAPGAGRAATAPDTARVYQIVKDQLLDLLTGERAPVFRVVDRSGAVLPPVADRAGVVVSGEGGPWEREVASVARRLTPAEPQTIGYLALDAAGDGSAPVAGRGLYEARRHQDRRPLHPPRSRRARDRIPGRGVRRDGRIGGTRGPERYLARRPDLLALDSG